MIMSDFYIQLNFTIITCGCIKKKKMLLGVSLEKVVRQMAHTVQSSQI